MHGAVPSWDARCGGGCKQQREGVCSVPIRHIPGRRGKAGVCGVHIPAGYAATGKLVSSALHRVPSRKSSC